ncbi:MAG: Ku protein [Beduini sp.]|uniref:non-homologous end joining protein Ku n=1 Tax=Beduini sp. TaxID=1922300 RepID=UPI0039A3F050
MPIAHKSAISVGMLYVPVSLHKTTRETGISFNQLCKDDSGNHQRIKYQKICPSCGKEVKSSEIIKGFEYEKGKYVTITEDELERIKTKKDKTIHVIHFAKITDVDPIMFDRDYYLAPEPGGEKAFELLRQALFSSKKIAIAKTVMGNKEELVALYPTKNDIIAKILFFQEEIQPIPSINKVQVDKKELEMAKMLIASMTEPFKAEEYEDEYQAKLREAIQTKINGQEIVTAGNEQQTTAIDLMTALQQTLEMANNHSIPS